MCDGHGDDVNFVRFTKFVHSAAPGIVRMFSLARALALTDNLVLLLVGTGAHD